MERKFVSCPRTLILGLFLLSLSPFGQTFAQESTSRGRRVSSAPAGEATITVSEQFLNSFLTAIFDNLNEPSMPLTIGGAKSTADCASEIKLKREVNGVRTAVHFENGRIAFSQRPEDDGRGMRPAPDRLCPPRL